ncbi:hypothetical protein BGU49_16725 [Clostridioides difficile]|nr:hypothetical protein BGU49_16725 [Clostridioides difficile]
MIKFKLYISGPDSYTLFRAQGTVLVYVCPLLLTKKTLFDSFCHLFFVPKGHFTLSTFDKGDS